MTEETLPSVRKINRVKRLTHTQMMRRMMPLLQGKLIELIKRWQGETDDSQVSEREVKVLTHLIAVLEKLMTLDERARADEAKRIEVEQIEANIDFEPLRTALEMRLQKIIDTRTPPDFSAEFE